MKKTIERIKKLPIKELTKELKSYGVEFLDKCVGEIKSVSQKKFDLKKGEKEMWVQSAHKDNDIIINLNNIVGLEKRNGFCWPSDDWEGSFVLEFILNLEERIIWTYVSKIKRDKEYNIITNLIDLKDLKKEEKKND